MENVVNIDDLIESYDVESDAILTNDFKDIKTKLWQSIEDYAQSINEYGEVMSRHLQRTSSIGAAFIKTLGFSECAANNFYHANLFHDLGKTHRSYHPDIWQTPHRPTPQEREDKRAHTRLGVELLDLALLKSPEDLQSHAHIRIIQSLQQYHHERVDGQGYEAIPEQGQGRIIKTICIIDAYDGDMIHRPHQPTKRTPKEALNRLKNSEKYQGAFDKDILEQFIAFTLD